MSILVVAASKAARRSKNAVVSGTGAAVYRIGSTVATTSNRKCMTVAVSIGRVLGGGFEDDVKR